MLYTLDEELQNLGLAKSSDFTINLVKENNEIIKNDVMIRQLYRSKKYKWLLDIEVKKVLDGDTLIIILNEASYLNELSKSNIKNTMKGTK